jgi:predicted DNA-binding transcriptional regulator AlpA
MDDKPKPPRLISFKQLKDRGVLLSRREIDRREIKNEFPKRVPLGPYRSAWVTEEVDAWVTEKIAARSTEIGALGTGDERRQAVAQRLVKRPDEDLASSSAETSEQS